MAWLTGLPANCPSSAADVKPDSSSKNTQLVVVQDAQSPVTTSLLSSNQQILKDVSESEMSDSERKPPAKLVKGQDTKRHNEHLVPRKLKGAELEGTSESAHGTFSVFPRK